ncbi:MAG TPA: DsrE family protein [Methanomassiliicoccales archaeon]|nr:DsrE family protein [Methanomassiliicoccales archaeon]HPR99106.1 DsrE family protein [Methanomassiliicoccales archaeon]
MAQSLLILVTKAPYGFEEAFAGLRAGLGMLASGQVPVSNALLVGEGTLNAVAAQKPEAVRMPSNAEAINDLLEFEAKVYVVKEDLLHLVGDVPLLEGVELIDWERARQVIDEHDMVTTF